MKISKKDIEGIVIGLNVTDMFKYPIGNKELLEKVRFLESQGIIYYKAYDSKWYFLNKRSIFFNDVE